MKKIQKNISFITSVCMLMGVISIAPKAEGIFDVDSYSFDGTNKVTISFTDNVDVESLDSLQILNSAGVDISDNLEITSDADNIYITFAKIYDSLSYSIKVNSDIMSVDGDSCGEHVYKLSGSGAAYDFDTNQDNTTDWQIFSESGVGADAHLYKNTLFISDNSASDTSYQNSGEPYSLKAAIVYDKNYASYDITNKSILEFDFEIHTKGKIGMEYESFSVFFGAGKFIPSSDNKSFTSENSAYIFRTTKGGKEVELRKWTGDSAKVGADSSSSKYTIGEAIGSKINLVHDVKTKYKYRIETNKTDAGTNIEILRATYGTDGVSAYETVMTYLDEEDSNMGKGYYFMTGSSFKKGQSTAFNSYSVDNLSYTSGGWDFIEYIEPVLKPEGKVSGNTVTLTFNESVLYDDLENALSVYCEEYKNEYIPEIELSKDGRTATINFDELQVNKKYYVVVDNDLKSADGFKMDSGYLFEFEVDGFKSSVKPTDAETAQWKIFGGSTKDMNTYINDGMLFIGKNKPSANTFEDVPYSTGGLMQKADYEEYIYENATLEFDYSSKNMTTVKGNGDWSGMRVLFNADPYVNEMGQWDTNISAEKGGYILNLSADNYKIKMGLAKWEGDKFPFGDRVSKTDIGTELVNLAAVRDYAYGDVVNVKISTKNTPAGEKIDVYIAPYENGVKGNYKKVITYLDENNPYTDGTFYFTACGTNAAYVNGYISAHHVNNVSYKTTKQVLSTELGLYADEMIEKINNFAGKTSVSNTEYSNLKDLVTVANILNDNGYEDIEGLEDLLALRKKIPEIDDVTYVNKKNMHSISVSFTQSMKDNTFSNDLIAMTCDGVEFNDFDIIKNDDNNGFEVEFYNDREYDSLYTLTVSAEAQSTANMQLMDRLEYNLNEQNILYSEEITFTDNGDGTVTANADISNDTDSDKEFYAILIATENIDNAKRMIGVDVMEDVISAKDKVKLSATFEKKAAECNLYIYDSKDDMIQLYKTISAEYNTEE